MSGWGAVNDLKYADTSRRGFMLMQFTPTEAKGTWHFVSTGEFAHDTWLSHGPFRFKLLSTRSDP
jgi:hypothetical protein